MAQRILWADRAGTDVTDIWFTIAIESSPTVADAMLVRIYDKLDVLAANPMIGSRRSDLTGKPRGFVVRPYTILYEPLPERGILVWRIVHGARDLRRIVKPPPKDAP